jgi:hypothetical protein
MIKFLRELFTDFHQAQQDMIKIGIWNIPTSAGMLTYVDEKQYYEHTKNVKKKDENN